MRTILTIVVPIYNAEKTIVRTIQSLLNQSNDKFKVILINDGSTDDSLELINRLINGDKRFKIYNHSNHGVSYTRNCGIKFCESEYISFLDSDDLYKNDFVEEFYKVVSLTPDLVVFKNPNEKSLFIRSLSPTNYIKHKNTPDTNCWIISIDILKENNLLFDEEISWGEDMLFFYSTLISSKRTIFINKIKTVTNNTVGSLSKTNYKDFKKKLVWLEKLKIISEISMVPLIDGYLRNGTIINSYANDEIDLKKALNEVKLINFSNKLRSLKQNLVILKMYVKYYLKYRRD